MRRSVITGFARTPFGKFGGKLSSLNAVELGSIAIKEAVSRSGVSGENINLAVIGQVMSAGCGQIPGRQAAIKAGIPASVPVDAINKVCASSMRAATIADQIIRAGDANVIVTGGMENMSQVPFASYDLRWGHKMFDVQFADLMVKDGLWCPTYDCHMAVHGGLVAGEYGVTREEQDRWAVRSQTRAIQAIHNGYLKREIVGVELKNGELLEIDEAPRENVAIDKLAKLSPIFSPRNTVTAGNAPGCNDGASALVVMDNEYAANNGLPIEAIIIGHAMCSEDSKNIAIAPGHAIQKLLQKVGMSIEEIDLIEINEAFAAVTLVSSKIIGCDLEKVNVNGGAIAFGHPLGASGGRIIMTLISELQRRNKRYGIAAICSGMGQGDALLVENAKYSFV